MRDRAVGLWGAVPRQLRRTIVAMIGATFILLGLALVVLPGPFTLPLLLLGFAVLGSEFAWAAAAMARTRRGMDAAAGVAKRAWRHTPLSRPHPGPTSGHPSDTAGSAPQSGVDS
jgi:hypothetical protein